MGALAGAKQRTFNGFVPTAQRNASESRRSWVAPRVFFVSSRGFGAGTPAGVRFERTREARFAVTPRWRFRSDATEQLDPFDRTTTHRDSTDLRTFRPWRRANASGRHCRRPRRRRSRWLQRVQGFVGGCSAHRFPVRCERRPDHGSSLEPGEVRGTELRTSRSAGPRRKFVDVERVLR